MEVYKKRSLLEIIFDSCSSGKNVLRGLELLSSEVTKGPIFDGHTYLVPLQVGIETKRKIFVEFLEIELSYFDKSGAFHEFYRKNKNRLNFAETDVSQAYKFYFTIRAYKVIEENNLQERVYAETTRVIERYFPKRLSEFPYERIREDYEMIRKQLSTAYRHYEYEIDKILKRIEYFDKMMGKSEKSISDDFKEAEKLKLSRTFQKILRRLPESAKFILQAIYSSVITTNTLKHDEEFMVFRLDKGEEAIENFLLTKRKEINKGLVTLIISEDVGARKKIQDIRRRSNNTIFILSSYGLAVALKELDLIENMNEIVDQSILDNIQARKKDNRRREKKGRVFNDQDVKEPEIEEKWALRLVEVINRGYWRGATPRFHNNDSTRLVQKIRKNKRKATLHEQIARIQYLLEKRSEEKMERPLNNQHENHYEEERIIHKKPEFIMPNRFGDPAHSHYESAFI